MTDETATLRYDVVGRRRIPVTMEIYTHGDGESRQDALKKVNGLFE
ncbi:hypothetical protein [Streptosporangium roseum]